MNILEVLTESNKDYLQFCLKVIDELTARGAYGKSSYGEYMKRILTVQNSINRS